MHDYSTLLAAYPDAEEGDLLADSQRGLDGSSWGLSAIVGRPETFQAVYAPPPLRRRLVDALRWHTSTPRLLRLRRRLFTRHPNTVPR